jgi:uncharacterized membrane protein YhaH (DUF805 family)
MRDMQSHTQPPFEISRKAYWLWIAALMVVLIVASLVGGLYTSMEISEINVDPTAGGPTTPGMEHRDPFTAFLYSRLGLVVILGVLQFLAANILFWTGAWVFVRVKAKRAHKSASHGPEA